MTIKEVILVEGKYDRQALENIIDATIIETGGFQIFEKPEQCFLLRRLAEKRGLVILTDSDRAGFIIRNHICGMVDKKYIKNAYIPNISGKERRKKTPSKEGFLGVEGMTPEIILQALKIAGVNIDSNESEKKANSCQKAITKADLYEDGLCGAENSVKRRISFLNDLNLPCRLSNKKLLEVLNILFTYDEYKKLIYKL